MSFLFLQVSNTNVQQTAIEHLNRQLLGNGLYSCCEDTNDEYSFFRACSDQMSRIGLPKLDHLQLRQIIILQMRDKFDVML